MRPVWIVVGLALVLFTGCGSAPSTPSADEAAATMHGSPVEEAVELPDEVFTDTAGQAYRLASTPTAPVVLLVFGYSHCDPRCSTAPQVLAAALATMPAADRDRVNAIFITVDPKRDSPKVLRGWLDGHAPGLIGLTGKPATIDTVAARVGVPISGKQKNGTRGYFVGHGTQIIAFGPERSATVTWEQDVAVDDLAEDLHLLVSR